MDTLSARLATRIANGWKRFQPIWSFSTRMTPQELQRQYDAAAAERKEERQRAHLARMEAHKARNAAWHAARGTDAAKLRAEREEQRNSNEESGAVLQGEKRISDLPADHYLQHVETVKELKRKGDLIGAEALLKTMLAAMEKECTGTGRSVRPWYYEQLATVYRRLGDVKSELAILERYFELPHDPGDKTRKLHERLLRVRTIAPAF